ncbi:MAG TPA: hypothetical protein VHE14_05350 [Solirubrobacteraceae bacterium]|nr:hypothetical protein [Solirubrobacteraceae bacterium]
MATTQRTYSFEAPAELADHLTSARAALGKLASEAPDVDAWTVREVEMGLARIRRDAPELAADSAGLMRAAVELVVDVIEKVAAGVGLADDLRAWERDDAEGDAFRRGALRASAPVWQDD